MYADRTIVLDRGNYTACTINLFGANMTSWRINHIEQLFVSTQAILNGKVAIRGGIPIIFPQYGLWTFGPHHGFARLMEWKVKKYPTRLENKDIEAILYLEDDCYSRSMWNYSFYIEYQIILAEYEVKLNLTLNNTDKETAMYAHLLLHPYIRVPNVTNCKIVGLVPEFLDKTTDQTMTDEMPITRIYDQTDRVYKNTKNSHIITNIMNNRKLKIEKKNCPDTVLWNPWTDKSKKLVDFGEEDYLKMICLAVGYAGQLVKVLKGDSTRMSLTLKLMRDDMFAELTEQIRKLQGD